MSSVNKVLLMGHLGSDPVVTDTATGKTLACFTMATNDYFKHENGEKVTRTDWHKITAWGKTAETCAKMLNKGSQVLVEGKIRNTLYTINNVETKNYEIFATKVTFLSNFGKKNDATPNASIVEDDSED